MKREVAEFVAKCLTCQKVKIQHMRPGGMMQPLEVSSWKMGVDFNGFYDGITTYQVS